jgi:hypothetical protein
MDQEERANSGHLPATYHLPDNLSFRHLANKKLTFGLVYVARKLLYDF